MTPARDPKPGWSYRTGWSQTGVGLPKRLRRRKSEAPKFHFLDFRQNRRKTNFLRGFVKNHSVESVAGEHTQLSPKDFPLSFTRARFLPGIAYFVLIFGADFELGAECLPLGGLRLLGSALKGRSVSYFLL